jgi:hypothetical protein
MPATTPVYGFPYPCPGETITPGSFQNLANAIDAKLLDLNADMVFALNRPNVDLFFATTQNIPPGVVTTLTSLDSTYTITTAGVWVVALDVSNSAGPTTVTYQRAQVLQNAVARFGFTQDSENNVPVSCRPIGVIVAAAGDVITGTFLWTGTGTYTVITKISAKLICRIP